MHLKLDILTIRTTMLFSLCTFLTLFAFTTCFDETTATNLESQEKYDDLFESREDFQNERNGNSDEYRYWGSNNKNDMNRYSSLSMQPEREFLHERSLKPAANLPLRFGRTSDDKVAKSIPNLPQRFGRYLSGKANIQSVANLPQRFGRSQYSNHFAHSLATLPLQFGRTAHSDRLQYEINSYPLEMKNPEEDSDRKKRQAMTFEYERNLQM
ncbi:PREDICTED: pro-FMRFamide-related neuropeptide VF [Nanorana parkeri]|uniref:pro-FMRFamide-related neuropeptide VF n=1 Tax=Nanorana parkeri TaxID=125878 RepID=UPI000854AC27|nr:PREDICTED: pro-FMRFamide-related neuropeptide VF [Nanorana parkeri]